MGHVRAEVRLPFGLVDPRAPEGTRARTATLTAITGHAELFGADDPNPFRAALHLLAGSTLELGPFRGAEVDPAQLGRLLPVDRDYLLLQLDRLTFGDRRYQTVECPQPACGRRLDVRFELSSVELPQVPDHAGGTVDLPGGRLVRFRLPVAADQAELHDTSPPALEAAFLRRCVVGDRGHGRGVGATELLELPAQIRAEVVQRIVAASPVIDLAVPLDCVSCGRPFRFVFDPVLSLLAALKASRTELVKQVHRMALSYHWSHNEILGLSRPLRHQYLELLQDEAGR
jgi:hypothetical protein